MLSPIVWQMLTQSLKETVYMVGISVALAELIGIPLGVILVITAKDGIAENPWLNRLLSAIVNIARSIPFIILLVAIIPFTRMVVGTSIGTAAATVPLTVAAIPFVARVVETALNEVDPGVVEAAASMGASTWQVITKVLLPEARPSLAAGVTLTTINLIGYSAMAGAVGGGGLGDLAIRYGYQRFRGDIMFLTVLVLVLLVQLLQMVGDIIVARLSHK